MIFVLFKKNLRQFLLLLFFPFANFADSFVAHNRDSSKSSMITASATSITGSSPTSVLALATRDEPLDQKPETENDVGRATEVNSNNMDGASPMDPRSCILNVGASAGKLCYVANQLLPERESETDALLTQTLAELFVSLWLTAKALRLDWVKSIRSKMALNAKKYPVEHCKVSNQCEHILWNYKQQQTRSFFDATLSSCSLPLLPPKTHSFRLLTPSNTALRMILYSDALVTGKGWQVHQLLAPHGNYHHKSIDIGLHGRRYQR